MSCEGTAKKQSSRSQGQRRQEEQNVQAPCKQINFCYLIHLVCGAFVVTAQTDVTLQNTCWKIKWLISRQLRHRDKSSKQWSKPVSTTLWDSSCRIFMKPIWDPPKLFLPYSNATPMPQTQMDTWFLILYMIAMRAWYLALNSILVILLMIYYWYHWSIYTFLWVGSQGCSSN